ncbi:MAG: ABC transporter permease [Epulopiscium sp.]|nr:ABC transporter permease [Candidatus Epulonipiscium sp.]
MEKRNNFFQVATTLIAVTISLLLACIIILFVSAEPMNAISTLLFGPIRSLRNFGNIIELMTTFMFTGLAISIMFQAGQFNVSVEGAFFLGGLISGGLISTLTLPGPITFIVAVTGGVLAGAIVTSIPGVLKAKFGASELVSSLMMNYVALYFGLFLLNNVFRDHSFGMLATHKIPKKYKLPVIVPGTRIHLGFILVVILIIVVTLFLFRTKTGYQIRSVGENTTFSKYTGVKIGKTVFLAQLLGGIIAGLGGTSEILGMYSRFQWTSLPQYGWDGVIVALLAGEKPQNVPLAAFFLAYLRIGSDLMARATDVPTELIIIIQAVIILLVTASALLSKFKQRSTVKEVIGDA